MKRILFVSILTLLSACGAFNSKWPSQSFISKNNYQSVILNSYIEEHPEAFGDKIDESPMYPNGVKGILKFVSDNFKYPEEARQKGLEGKVYVSFLINPEGSLEGVEVVKSSHEIFDPEAIRTVKAMDRWIPAKLKGEFVEFRYTIPIALKLN
jgi:TonB family protein